MNSNGRERERERFLQQKKKQLKLTLLIECNTLLFSHDKEAKRKNDNKTFNF